MKITKLNFITILVVTIIVFFYLGRISRNGIIKITNYESKHTLDSIKHYNDSIVLSYQDAIAKLLTEIDSIDSVTIIYKYKEYEEIDKLPSYTIRQLDSIAFSNTNRHYMLWTRGFANISAE